MSLLDVFAGRSSVSEYLGGETSPVRTSGGQDNESIQEQEDSARLDKVTEVPSSDDVAARRRRTTREPPATPPVALTAPVPLADVSGGAPPLPAAAPTCCFAAASPLRRLCTLTLSRYALLMAATQLTLSPTLTLTR